MTVVITDIYIQVISRDAHSVWKDSEGGVCFPALFLYTRTDCVVVVLQTQHNIVVVHPSHYMEFIIFGICSELFYRAFVF